MRPGPRALSLLGVVAVLAPVLLYAFWPQPEPVRARRSPSPEVSTPGPPKASARAAPGVPDDPAPSPEPHAAPVPSSAAESFEQPASPELYWQELERLKRSDPEHALAYALIGDDWYTNIGRPAEARHAMVVTLLVDLHRMTEARERARTFIAEHPSSSYRPLVQGVTGIHPRPGRPSGHSAAR
jgi:hypothetical protein